MKIGLFGGTFDPIHLGHLILAERCREDAKLDEIRFVPSYAPPHKAVGVSRFESRCEMALLAIAGRPEFRLETIEKELPAPSYTLRTVRELQFIQPEHEFSLIVGGDTLPELRSWYEPHALLKLVSLIAVPRPGVEAMTAAELAASLNMPEADVRLTLVSSPLIDISGRDLRKRVATGRTVRYLVPRAVEEYIREKKLYSQSSSEFGIT